ncbi:hypothetical protein TYRP_022025 [Tyrophagus putrescentiae]|nr:hypothetical protein TYRP_022025 [Tyrophagus putrescentiae]
MIQPSTKEISALGNIPSAPAKEKSARLPSTADKEASLRETSLREPSALGGAPSAAAVEPSQREKSTIGPSSSAPGRQGSERMPSKTGGPSEIGKEVL